MQCFWDLAQIDENVRLEATVRLVQHVVSSQEDFERLGSVGAGSGSGEDTAADAVGLCNTVEYALKR